MALIEPDSDADLHQLAEKLQKRFANIKAAVIGQPNNDKLTIAIDDYLFTVYLSGSEHVLIESKEMSDTFIEDYAGNPVDKQVVASCARRFELSGGADYEMNYFNHSLFILECMEELKGVTILCLD
jgi:hypothetical protein